MIRTAIASLIIGSCAGAGGAAQHVHAAADPGCSEDDIAVVYNQPNGDQLTWVCVGLDSWADDASIAQLEVILDEAAADDVCTIWPDGSIHRYLDPIGVDGTVTPCP